MYAVSLAKQMHFVAVVPVKCTTLKLDLVSAETDEVNYTALKGATVCPYEFINSPR